MSRPLSQCLCLLPVPTAKHLKSRFRLALRTNIFFMQENLKDFCIDGVTVTLRIVFVLRFKIIVIIK
jgi:hypothetical protein